MVERRTPIPVSEAVQKVMAYAYNGPSETVCLEETHGRYLGEDVVADHDVPHFHRSRYDGYAIKAKNSLKASQNNPVEFEVIEEVGAGFIGSKEVNDFQAVRIMTGAQIPDQCNAVVMFESTEEYEKNGQPFISITRPVAAGENMTYKGEDVVQGTVLLTKGTYINPGVRAVLSTFGYAKVKVIKKTEIGIYTTGTELLEIDEPIVPGKIRNSNGQMLQAQIERAGGQPHDLGKLADNFEECYQSISQALERFDFLITTGGVSVGDFDYMPAIYRKLGAQVLFNKIAMRPGSVTTVAELNGKLLFGLSGNPSSCYVGFELYVRPVIQTYLNSKKPYLKKTRAKLMANFQSNPFTRFVRSRVFFNGNGLIASPTGLDKPNMISSLVEANALSVLPGRSEGFSRGEEIDVLLLCEESQDSEWSC
ncbi:gephyrin-like molybdotransferase Glp [Terrilactibacillus laevilacticus]|uniref:molybdopterin molybdotransferase MoeA n=1 Tax=Terrilactibacillus laevilacticus TaxID=1380157 RepID=UPI00114680EC|nr:gephyrin-like molybdotransferase Glp [Terrilactibacillus laevilacticus]